MLKYFERKMNKITQESHKKLKLDNFPLYYSESGQLIREEKDGAKFAVIVDKSGNETVLRRIS